MRLASVRAVVGAAGLGGAFVAGGMARDYLNPSLTRSSVSETSGSETSGSLLEATKERLRTSMTVSANEDPTKVRESTYCSLDFRGPLFLKDDLFKVHDSLQERTFIMVKPDGVQRGLVGDIIKR